MNPDFLSELEALATKYSYNVYGNIVDLSPEAESTTPEAFQVNTPAAPEAPADESNGEAPADNGANSDESQN